MKRILSSPWCGPARTLYDMIYLYRDNLNDIRKDLDDLKEDPKGIRYIIGIV